MYQVTELFADLQDNSRVYIPGDVFPRKGVEVSDKRLEELSTCNNLRGIPLIKMVGNERKSVNYTKTDISRMSTADLQTLAKEQGIGGAELLSGAELKKLLIERFNL